MFRNLGYINIVSHLVSRQLGRNLICILVALNVVLAGQLHRLEEEKMVAGFSLGLLIAKTFALSLHGQIMFHRKVEAN